MLPTGRSFIFNYQRGFTLLEVLIVVVIIGLTLGITLPDFGGMLESVEIRAGMRKITNIIQEARARAIISGDIQRVQIYYENIQYDISDKENYKTTTLNGFKFFEEETMYFYPDGTTSGKEIRVQAPDNQEYILTINPLTGEVNWN